MCTRGGVVVVTAVVVIVAVVVTGCTGGIAVFGAIREVFDPECEIASDNLSGDMVLKRVESTNGWRSFLRS